MLSKERLVVDLIFYRGLNLIKKNKVPNIIVAIEAPINDESNSENRI